MIEVVANEPGYEDLVVVRLEDSSTRCPCHDRGQRVTVHLGYVPGAAIPVVSDLNDAIGTLIGGHASDGHVPAAIADLVEEVTGTEDVAVIVEARCASVVMRNVMRGAFRDDATLRRELLAAVRRAR